MLNQADPHALDVIDAEMTAEPAGPNFLTHVAVMAPVMVVASLAAAGIQYGIKAGWDWYNEDEIKEAQEKAKAARKAAIEAATAARKAENAEFLAEMQRGLRGVMSESTAVSQALLVEIKSLNQLPAAIAALVQTSAPESKPARKPRAKKATTKRKTAVAA
jgi:hypothetical protein